jgi:hypothetical protein
VGEAYGHGGVEVLESWDQVGVGIGVGRGDAGGAQGDEGREEEEEFEEVGMHCCSLVASRLLGIWWVWIGVI